jgi:hypothetical protein
MMRPVLRSDSGLDIGIVLRSLLSVTRLGQIEPLLHAQFRGGHQSPLICRGMFAKIGSFESGVWTEARGSHAGPRRLAGQRTSRSSGEAMSQLSSWRCL